MYKEILTKKQISFLPWLPKVAENFGLVGGTAIALQLGHRQSIDFDFVSAREINSPSLRKIIASFGTIGLVMQDSRDEYSVVINDLKLTFFYYPFPLKFAKKIDNLILLPDVLTLAAMKAYALGRRAKWKDYVDLYFISKQYNSPAPLISRAKSIFKKEFNEKNFRAQLAYFKDIDYSEQVIYMKGFAVSDKIIKKELIEFSLTD